MPSIISSSSVEASLRKALIKQGFKVNRPRLNGEGGVDILANDQYEQIYIEAISYKSSGPARAKDFFQVFFRSISRINDGAKRSVIALPKKWENGLIKRAKIYGSSWLRLGKAFPEIEIWLVDTEKDSYSISKWNKWLKNPS